MKKLIVYRNPDIEKYKKTVQFIIDGWVAICVALDRTDEKGNVGTRTQFYTAIDDFISSNPPLDIRDFGYLYILLKERKYPEEIIEDISKYFERGATLGELCEAYKERS